MCKSIHRLMPAILDADDDVDDDLVIFFIIITVFNQLLITAGFWLFCFFLFGVLFFPLALPSRRTREVLKTWRCQIKGATKLLSTRRASINWALERDGGNIVKTRWS